MAPAARNWFEGAGGGGDYARFRPCWPARLARHLAGLAPDRALAVDLGCGTGQLTALLAPLFERTLGIDPSASQIAHAAPGPRYLCAPAEHLPLEDSCASLITAAQAAHWFDLPAVYAEVRRIARPGAVLALLSYAAPRLAAGPLQDRLARFQRDEIARFWPPERALVESGYAGIDFPFAEIALPPMQIRLDWPLAGFLGYVGTWSALRAADEAGAGHLAQGFAADMAALWGDPARRRRIAWPIAARIGRV